MIVNFLLPAVPGIANMLVAFIAVVIWGKQKQPWVVAHIGRLAGIVVFLWCAWLFRVYNLASFQHFFHRVFSISLVDVALLLPAVGLLRFFQLRQLKRQIPDGLETYTQAQLSVSQSVYYAVVWLAYLFLYEAYFRSYLLFYAFDNWSRFWLYAYNILLYAVVHAYKNLQQVLASIPFGIVLCAAAWVTGHFWFAFVVHATLALGFELPLLRKKTATSV